MEALRQPSPDRFPIERWRARLVELSIPYGVCMIRAIYPRFAYRVGPGELESIVGLAAVRAATKFQVGRISELTGKRTSWRWYVGTAFKRECWHHAYRNRQDRRLPTISTAVMGLEGEEYQLPCGGETVEETTRRRELPAEVVSALRHLDARSALVLRLRYGFDGNGSQTHSVVGEMIGVSKERVRQIEGEAICKIKNAIAREKKS